jgi:hypothetical protein
MQGDVQKTWKHTKLKIGLFCCHNCLMQELFEELMTPFAYKKNV